MSPTLLRRSLAALAAVSLLCLILPALAAPDDEKPLGKVPADLALVPKDALWFVTVRAADLVGHPTVKKLMPLVPAPGGPRGDFLVGIENLIGIAPSAIERITFLGRRMRSEPVMIIRTARALDREAILKKVGPSDENTVHGKKVFSVRGEFGPPRAYHFADDHTVILGWANAVVPYLAALKGAGKTHPLADELKVAGGRHSVVMAARPSLLFRSIDAEEREMRGRWEKERPRFKDKGIRKDLPPKDVPRNFDKDVIKDKAPPPPPPLKDLGRRSRRGDPGFVALRQEKEVAFKDDRPKDFPRRDRPPVRMEELDEKPLKLRKLEEITEDTEDRWRAMNIIPYLPAVRASRVLLTVDVGEQITANGKAEFDSEADAKDGEVVGRMGLYLLREMFPRVLEMEMGLFMRAPGIAAMVKQYKDAIRAVEVARDGNTITAVGKAKLDFAPLLKHIADELPVQQDANNLKQIGLAVHNYHSAHNYFPPAICNRDGKPLLSWRVAILPYVEQEALYRQFKLDEPWDSPHNKKLLGKMPKIYASPTGTAEEPDATFYQMLTGPKTLFPRPDHKMQIFRIPDGTSNTFLVVEAGKAVPWTKPEDVAIPAMGKLPKFGGQFPKFFNVVFADGSVRRIKRDADEELLRLAIDPADGNVIDFRKLSP